MYEDYDMFKKIKNFLKEQKKYKVKLTQVAIDISNNCNAKCPFCSRQLSKYSQKGFMEKEVFYDIMRQIEKIKSVEMINLGVWGEPLMHPHFDEFARYIKSKGYSLFFPTNFSLADKHFDTLMLADSIMLSIEGWDKESYEFYRKNLNFEKTLENIIEFDKLVKERKEQGLKTPLRDINFLVSKETNVNAFISLWEKYVDLISVRPMFAPFTWNEDKKVIEIMQMPELKSKLLPLKKNNEQMYCIMPFNIAYIRANGKLALCCSDYDIQLDFGDYKNLLHNFKYNKNLNDARKGIRNNKGICANCFQHMDIPISDMVENLPDLSKFAKTKVYSLR